MSRGNLPLTADVRPARQRMAMMAAWDRDCASIAKILVGCKVMRRRIEMEESLRL
jgi:hypothetical protein